MASLILVLVLSTVVSAAGQVEAHAAAAEEPVGGTGVGITPARVELDLDGRTYELDLTVFNDGEEPRAVEIDVVRLGHELDGTPSLLGSLPQATQTTGQTDYVLAPGESVAVSYQIDFSGFVSIYGAVVVRVAPPGAGEAIALRTQVASLFLLRGPRPWDQSVSARDVGLVRTSQGQRLLFADLQNDGNAHTRPTGRFRVLQAGEEVAVVELNGENIIPGFARRSVVPAPALDDAAGEVTIELELDGGATATATADPADLPEPTPVTPLAEDEVPGTAVLERPEDASGTEIGNQRRLLLPIAAFLILLAIGALFLLLWWQRRDQEEDEDETPAVAAARSGADDGRGD